MYFLLFCFFCFIPIEERIIIQEIEDSLYTNINIEDLPQEIVVISEKNYNDSIVNQAFKNFFLMNNISIIDSCSDSIVIDPSILSFVWFKDSPTFLSQELFFWVFYCEIGYTLPTGLKKWIVINKKEEVKKEIINNYSINIYNNDSSFNRSDLIKTIGTTIISAGIIFLFYIIK